MSQQLKEKLILIAAITGAILLIAAVGITGYIAITDPHSREGIASVIVFSPFTAMILYAMYKSWKD